MELPERKHIRLKNYDYSQNGAYFITICSQNKLKIFGDIIVEQGLCSCRLSNTGKIIKEEIDHLPIRFPQIRIDNYVIMPNHIHLLLIIDDKQQTARAEPLPYKTINSTAVSDIICALKSITTKSANKADDTSGRKIWQFRYHDHVIRSEYKYQKIWKYINENPLKWAEDRYFIS